jgi:hypothetical protein
VYGECKANNALAIFEITKTRARGSRALAAHVNSLVCHKAKLHFNQHERGCHKGRIEIGQN